MRLRIGKPRMLGVVVLACTATLGLGATAITGASAATSAVGTLSLYPTSGRPGTLVHAVGSGFSPGEAVELTWQKVTGSWDVTTSGEFLGANYTPSFVPVASAVASPTGSLATSFRVPAGFGFTHDVLATNAGQTVGQAEFKVSMSASISPLSGPVGTPIHIRLSGIGFAEYHQDWNLLYDERLTGWISAVTTQGTANVTIPATGTPGVHELGIYPGSDREPYLNTQQAPTGNPTFHFSFTVTPGAPVLPRSAAAQTPAAVSVHASAGPQSGPAVSLNRAAGPPGTPLTFQGSGFPADQAAQVLWSTQKGSHLTTLTSVEERLATVETSPSGTLTATLHAPSDLGGEHQITVQVGSASASTSFTITPEDLGIKPSSGPVGTEMTIHLHGVGISWISNTYGVVYDNGDIGYVCGVNSGGNVVLHLRATGAPGWHFIELYPAIWKIADVEFATADYFQVPQLSYAADNPGGRVPEFGFAFDITS